MFSPNLMIAHYVRKRTPMLDGRAVNVEVTERTIRLEVSSA